MGYRPVTGLLVYVVSVAGVATLVTELGESMVRHAAYALALDGTSVPRSRVDRGLEAQARIAAWQPSHYVVETRALKSPDISAVALAHSLDVAESKPAPPPAAKAKIPKARVAGWVKRARRAARGDDTLADAECPARIIERSLKAEI